MWVHSGNCIYKKHLVAMHTQNKSLAAILKVCIYNKVFLSYRNSKKKPSLSGGIV